MSCSALFPPDIQAQQRDCSHCNVSHAVVRSRSPFLLPISMAGGRCYASGTAVLPTTAQLPRIKLLPLVQARTVLQLIWVNDPSINEE